MDECHAIHSFDVRYFLLIRWRCWSRNFNIKKQSSRFDAFKSCEMFATYRRRSVSHHEVGLIYLSHRVQKKSLVDGNHDPKGFFWEVLLSQQTDDSWKVLIETNFEVIRFSFGLIPQTQFSKQFPRSDFMGFQRGSGGIGFGQSHHG